MAIPNAFDMPPEGTKKIRLGISRTNIGTSEPDIVAISDHLLYIAGYQAVDTASVVIGLLRICAR